MLRDDPAAAVRELETRGHSLFDPDAVDEIKVVTSPKGTMHIPLSRVEEGYTMSSDELDRIHGGAVSTLACASSASTMSSATSTLSTATTASSIGTGGSIGA
ncbi:MAG: hypothetical protein ACR2P7_04350 [bacterium]